MTYILGVLIIAHLSRSSSGNHGHRGRLKKGSFPDSLISLLRTSKLCKRMVYRSHSLIPCWELAGKGPF